MRKKKQPQIFELSLEFEGKTYTATYTVTGRIPVVSVQTVWGSNSTQVGGSSAQSIARILFREFLQGAKSRGELGG